MKTRTGPVPPGLALLQSSVVEYSFMQMRFVKTFYHSEIVESIDLRSHMQGDIVRFTGDLLATWITSTGHIFLSNPQKV